MPVNLPHNKFLRHCRIDCHMGPLFLHLDTNGYVQVILTHLHPGEKKIIRVISLENASFGT